MYSPRWDGQRLVGAIPTNLLFHDSRPVDNGKQVSMFGSDIEAKPPFSYHYGKLAAVCKSASCFQLAKRSMSLSLLLFF